MFFKNVVNKQEDLDEKVELHDMLNPKIWKDDKLLPEVVEKIHDIVDVFLDKLDKAEIDIDVKDICIVGSNANFNYSDKSDLDIHIIADSSLNCDENHLDKLYQAYKAIFNDRYDITINGINVELYVELDDNLSASKNSNGVYSIYNGWIKQPVRADLPEIDEVAVEKGTAEWEKRYLEIIEDPSIENIDQYINDICDLRIESHKTEGEFGTGNLIFKEIRKLGYLQTLKDLKISLQNKELSL